MGMSVRITGGKLERDRDATIFIGDDGRQIRFEHIHFRVGAWFIPRRVAFQWCGCIYIGRVWAASGFTLNMFAHEYGHYLQQHEMGCWRYIWRVALPSVWSVLSNPHGHLWHPVEEDATRRGMRYLAKQEPWYGYE